MLIALSSDAREPHAWVHDEVRDAGNGIVPAEILEIQEVQFPVRSPQGVVRTEIGWDQGAAFRGNLGGEIKSPAAGRPRKPPLRIGKVTGRVRRRKMTRTRDVMLDRFEFGVTALNMDMMRRPERTGFGGLADLRPGRASTAASRAIWKAANSANIGIRNGIHRIAVDPGEQGVTKLGRYRDDSRCAANTAAFEKNARRRLRPQADSVVGGGVFLQRVATDFAYRPEKMRMLFPLRSSAIALTGSGLNARAISSISSGGWKERITNFVPRGVLSNSLCGSLRRESCDRPPAFRRAQALRQDRRRTRRIQVPVFASTFVIPRASK